jgi:hypothetical protein
VDAPYLEHCKNVLKQAGYLVIARERRVILTASYVMPPQEAQRAMSIERLTDMIQMEQERRLGRALFDQKLIVNHMQPTTDPVTGPEDIFTSAIACIKPKAADEV